MKKSHASITKERVATDFNKSLNTFVRALSTEEINIKNEFKKSEDKKEFYVASTDETITGNRSIKRNRSIYRNQSFKKYEIVVTDTENSNVTVSTRPIISRNSMTEKEKQIKPKVPTHFQRFLTSFSTFKSPFERTSIANLPFYLRIELEGKDKCIKIKVTQFYEVDYVKSKIFRKEQIEVIKQALFFEDKRLEGSSLLYIHNIQSTSRLKLKLCEKIKINGKFESKTVSLNIHDSITGRELKKEFAKELSMALCDFELRFNDLKVENKELFVYSIIDESEIHIVEIVKNLTHKESVGHKVVQNFYQMTGNITKCKCEKLRNDAISRILLAYSSAMFDSSASMDEIISYKNFLEEFDKSRRLHHVDCFKLAQPIPSEQESYSKELSNSGNSLKSEIWDKNDNRTQRQLEPIDEEFIKLIADTQDFKTFKHLISNKIGTKCNLRSVALLYRYTRYTVRYIGINEHENNPQVIKILDFTELYFEKYFQKDIIKGGGLDNPTSYHGNGNIQSHQEIRWFRRRWREAREILVIREDDGSHEIGVSSSDVAGGSSVCCLRAIERNEKERSLGDQNSTYRRFRTKRI